MCKFDASCTRPGCAYSHTFKRPSPVSPSALPVFVQPLRRKFSYHLLKGGGISWCEWEHLSCWAQKNIMVFEKFFIEFFNCSGVDERTNRSRFAEEEPELSIWFASVHWLKTRECSVTLSVQFICSSSFWNSTGVRYDALSIFCTYVHKCVTYTIGCIASVSTEFRQRLCCYFQYLHIPHDHQHLYQVGWHPLLLGLGRNVRPILEWSHVASILTARTWTALTTTPR